jgi:antitoxin component YwqK of YwqJK toxin-antitoxin module
MKAGLSFFLVFIIIGCKRAETKKIFFTFPNGQAGQVRYYPNPEDTLTYRKEVFYSNGAKAYIGEIANGKKNSAWIWWYPNGKRKDQCKYDGGIVVDTVYHWYENGAIQQIEVVQKGKHVTDSCNECDGTIIWYYENGRPKEMFTNLDGIQQDTAKRWYENGQIEWYSYYKNGKEDGLSESFYSNGQKEKSCKLVNGLRDGKMTCWDSLGKIISDTNYEMGKIRD